MSGYPTTQPYSRAGLLAKLTGVATLAAGALLHGQGTALVATLPLGTAGRLLVAGASAPAWSDSGLSYASSVLTVAGSVPGTPSAGQVAIGGGAIKAGGAINGASLTASGLTPTHVLHATTGGLVTGSATLTFGGTDFSLAPTESTVYSSSAAQGDLGARFVVNNINNNNDRIAQLVFRQRNSATYDCSIGASGGSSAFLFFKVLGTERLGISSTAITTALPISAASLTATGGAAAAATIYKSASFGLTVQGAVGSSYDFGFLKPDGSAFLWYVPTGTANVVFPGGSIVVGTTALAGSERARFTGGTAPGTPGSTDVLIGAGQIKAGGAISATSLTATGLVPGRIAYTSTGGLQIDSAALKFDVSGSARTLTIDNTFTDTSGTLTSLNSTVRANPGSASSSQLAAMSFGALSNSGNAQNLSGSTYALCGVQGFGYHFGSGTANKVFGGYFGAQQRSGAGAVAQLSALTLQVDNLDTSTAVTGGYGINVLAPANSGGNFTAWRAINIAATAVGTTNCIGIDIGAMTGTGPFAIRTAAGIVSFGDTTDATTISDGSARFAGGVSVTKATVGLTFKATSTTDGAITTAGKITAKAAVPGSFADLAAVQTYLASILT